MKKKIILTGALLVAITLGIVGMSAFEAHVVNVTAKIENALVVPQELGGLGFGTVFPEEVAFKNLDIQLSQSFLNEPRVDDVEYMIRQKPKCGVPAVPATDPVSYTSFPQVTENVDGVFQCPEGSVMLPLLCPYLSKFELDANGATTTNGIAAFHGPLTGWTMSDTLAYQQLGRLSKADGQTSASWLIDLHAPCFKDSCAQDNVVPAAYQADPINEHQMFGCDLWVEVKDISLSASSTLTVIKHVINDNGGTKTASDFTMNVSGVNVSNPSFQGAEDPGITVTLSPGAYTVTEGAVAGYDAAQSADCVGTIALSQHKTCVITNDDNPPTEGTLTVTKVVVNDGGGTKGIADFPLFVDTVSVTSGAATIQTPGNHTVTETTDPNYISSFTGDCDTGGVVNVPTGGSAACTLTNTFNPGHLIVHKNVINEVEGTIITAADFQMTVDGNNVVQDASNTVIPGNHTVGEDSNPNYNVSFSAECPNGIANVPAGATVTCTLTNHQKFATLTLNKVVNNIHGGNHVAANFNLFASGDDATTQLTTGVPKKVVVGSLFINEQGVIGYQAAFTGDCDTSGQITLAAGDNKQCTITNTDLQPNITLVKVVDVGPASPLSFALRIDGVVATQSSSVGVTSNTTHAITEDPHTSYHFVSMSGTGSQGSSCPTTLGGTVILNEGETITCTIHNAHD